MAHAGWLRPPARALLWRAAAAIWVTLATAIPAVALADMPAPLTVEEEAVPPEPMDEAQIQSLVDQAVEARLAGIPRPRDIPATDLVPPRGLVLFKNAPRDGDFPFSLAIGGFLQLRWLEFARSATSWINSVGPPPRPINNINTFNL
ncbi:MAG: hypothetical protein ACKOK8_09190, partial [Planctomycetia bacterium]